ncbi:hypothetical protein [Mannheimia haemolytica]|uniref:hypothetical protein n=1 Tax=Mannheimia haemolytica TaxID=75985 RepID=UPI0001BCFF6A|nr:hypothetical protein [Mannheimia haemolytica]EEY12918.1 hypothetical protein COK_1033 [Mannheimia haemolytica serotype A2 str. BOVINE]TRC64870.1 hypothetical protein FEA31_12545 [Mannheimia haemolytica]TRC67878.1 hypothetical protein FEA29_10180 [Mannheimia haemolytica]HDL3366336.1 hypothetical protein [Mannheimia haemolytica]
MTIIKLTKYGSCDAVLVNTDSIVSVQKESNGSVIWTVNEQISVLETVTQVWDLIQKGVVNE